MNSFTDGGDKASFTGVEQRMVGAKTREGGDEQENGLRTRGVESKIVRSITYMIFLWMHKMSVQKLSNVCLSFFFLLQ